ncbi:hypothetical protein BX667DRAFT_507431 [Coemansia mojavensis]|nr:hypothetical protein BX667DRAFT_507431 [Coemansia mojavensis]
MHIFSIFTAIILSFALAKAQVTLDLAPLPSESLDLAEQTTQPSQTTASSMLSELHEPTTNTTTTDQSTETSTSENASQEQSATESSTTSSELSHSADSSTSTRQTSSSESTAVTSTTHSTTSDITSQTSTSTQYTHPDLPAITTTVHFPTPSPTATLSTSRSKHTVVEIHTVVVGGSVKTSLDTHVYEEGTATPDRTNIATSTFIEDGSTVIVTNLPHSNDDSSRGCSCYHAATIPLVAIAAIIAALC